MFKFTLSEKFKQRGVSPDAISPEMRNRFDVFFNENGTGILDGRLQVRLDETVIRFFFYKDNINADVLIEDKYQEIASISLDNVKETGYDILYFKEQVERKGKSVIQNMSSYCLQYCVFKHILEYCRNMSGDDGIRFKGFPFIKQLEEIENDDDCELVSAFSLFIQCCFLYFLFEFENRESDFPNSSIYDNVRDKLRQSDVYQLLCAKVNYTIRLYEGTAPLSEEDYNTITLKYADWLMDKNQNRIVPHDYYGAQLWFYDPESELDFIVQRNAKNCKKHGEAKLNNKIYGKLRDFFFTRHAMVSAMGNKWTKITYSLYLGVVCFFSIFATLCMLSFDSGSKTVEWFFGHIIWWDWIAVGAIGILVVLWCSTRSFSVFMPRVLIAIGIGWLTTFISEDLIKSQVSIHRPLANVALLCVFFLICLLILGEIRKYSPFYFGSLRQYHEKLLFNHSKNEKDGWREKVRRLEMWIRTFLNYLRATHPSSWKLAPILIHSYFWALTLGVVMQLAVYKDLIEHSKVLPEVVFRPTFEKADSYMMYLNNLRDVLVSYKDNWIALCSSSSQSIGTSKGNDKLLFVKIYPNPDFPMYAEYFQHKADDIIKKYDAVRRYRRDTWDSCEKAKNKRGGTIKNNDFVDLEYGSAMAYPLCSLYFQLMKPIQKLKNEKLIATEKFKVIAEQLLYLDEVIFQTEEEIRKNKLFVSNNENWDSLIFWSEYEHVNWKAEPKNLQDCFKLSAICEKNLCRNVNDLWWVNKKEGERLYIFPRMLIFHTLIVLIIAFVGNLIISDKSITEPL